MLAREKAGSGNGGECGAVAVVLPAAALLLLRCFRLLLPDYTSLAAVHFSLLQRRVQSVIRITSCRSSRIIMYTRSGGLQLFGPPPLPLWHLRAWMFWMRLLFPL